MILVLTSSCGSGGPVKTTDDADGSSGVPEDTWPGDLYRGEVDLFTDSGPEDVDVPMPEDTPIAYDTDYIPDDAIVFPPDTDPDQYVDGVCKPDCTFEDGTEKDCGVDGCGSLCGVCGFGFECKAGLCAVECLADCAGRECGPDPTECDESCGTCDEGFFCNPAGKCNPICDPEINCATKECGADGCGGSCGICPGNEICTAAQVCVPHPCGDVEPVVGKCQGQDLLIHCVNNALVEFDCSGLGEDFWCGFDAQEGVYECKQGCEPQCEFPNGNLKECGYDGCYGNCGDCPGGWDCVSGLCNPNQGGDCGWIPATGSCYTNVLWFCDDGILYFQDCAAQGLTCKYNSSIYAYNCSN
ncbi:MAG: hypothetical protein ABIK09_18225 [Pseudomonadota bacterium]